MLEPPRHRQTALPISTCSVLTLVDGMTMAGRRRSDPALDVSSSSGTTSAGSGVRSPEVMVWTGEVTWREVAGLREQLFDQMDTCRDGVSLDVRRVTVIDRTGLALLIGANHRAHSMGRPLSLVDDAGPVTSALTTAHVIADFDVMRLPDPSWSTSDPLAENTRWAATLKSLPCSTGVKCSFRRSTVTTSARLPGVSEPVISPSPSARAPASVAMPRMSHGSPTVGSSPLTLASSDANFISSSRSRLLFSFSPSDPRPTSMPARRKSMTRAGPEASFMFEQGQWAIDVPVWASSSISRSSSQTQWATTVRSPRMPRL